MDNCTHPKVNQICIAQMNNRIDSYFPPNEIVVIGFQPPNKFGFKLTEIRQNVNYTNLLQNIAKWGKIGQIIVAEKTASLSQ